jgi:phosphoribosylglycinamide formyltransferase-1
VFVSGSGTLLQALLDAAATDDYPADIVAVVADRDGIEGLARAERAGVPTHVLKVRDFADRPTWDQALADLVGTLSPDLIVTAGFMKLFGEPFMNRFGDRVLNSHPALSPAFPGAHAVRDALAYGVRVTGCTVFLVDNGVDTGPVVAQEAVPVEAGDDEATLHERIKKVERRLLVDVVARLAREGWTLDGRKVSIP